MASLCAGTRDSRVLVCAGARALLLAPPLGEGEARVVEFDTRSDTQGQAPGTVSAGAQGLILAACLSSRGDLIAIADDFKRLSVFRVRSSWERLFSCSVPRCCTALALVPDGHPAPSGENGGARDAAGGAIVLAADRAGDVYHFRVTPGSPAQIAEEAVNGQPLLGHLSMLLDLAVTEDARFVVTSDRDEKVRVSLLDAPHNIHTFCLGHTAFVSRVTLMKNHPDKLLTGSGDGTVRLWDLTSGREISSCNLNPSPDEQRKEHPVSCVAHTATLDMIAAVCEGLPGVHLLHLVNCAEEGRDPTMHSFFHCLKRSHCLAPSHRCPKNYQSRRGRASRRCTGTRSTAPRSTSSARRSVLRSASASTRGRHPTQRKMFLALVADASK
ncbi:tRNA (guanine-N(7)-)-methyltransferase non-catalytic subunit WDR4 isoform X2 [Lampetra fluviatilis]